LATACDGVGDLEGEFCGRSVALTTLEGDSRCALAEVCGATSGGTASSVASVAVVGIALVCVSSIAVVGVAVVLVCVSSIAVVLVCVSGVAVVLVCVSSIVGVVACVSSIVGVVAGVSLVCVALVGISSISLVGIALICVASIAIGISSVAVVLVGIAGVSLVCVALVGISSVTASCSTTSCGLGNNEITETSLVKEVEDTQAISVERSALSLLAKRSNSAIDIDIRVDERSDATELRGNRERWVTTDVLSVATSKGVGVLLGSNESDGSSNGICASTKLGDDLVSTGKLL
jgi:hypothetical protein